MKTLPLPRLRFFTLSAVAVAAMYFGVAASNAAILYTTSGGVITQGFSGLNGSGNTIDGANVSFTSNVTIPGWYGSNNTNAYQASGSSSGRYLGPNSFMPSRWFFSGNATGRVITFSPISATPDPAQFSLGLWGSQYVGVHFVNNTGSALTEFSLSYTAQQWAANVNATALNFSYLVATGTAAPANFSGWVTGATTVTELGWTAPHTATTPGEDLLGIDGTLAANSAARAHTITLTTPWAAGDSLFLTWQKTVGVNEAAFGIDDVQFSAIPEPSVAWLLLAGIGTLMSCRRRPRTT